MDLCASGQLHLITSEHLCGGDCAAYAEPVTSPAHFVVHAVTRLELLPHRGTVRAHTDEGDFCEGEPGVLLVRLLQATYGTKERAREAVAALKG